MAKKKKDMGITCDRNELYTLVIGVGIGILMTYPVVGVHPVRWGMGFLVVGLFGKWFLK